jgi:hypothetical protein
VADVGGSAADAIRLWLPAQPKSVTTLDTETSFKCRPSNRRIIVMLKDRPHPHRHHLSLHRQL